MTRRVRLALVALGILVLLGSALRWRRRAAAEADIVRLRREVAALEGERKDLQQRLDALMPADKRIVGMPKADLRLGIPTSLIRELVERVTAGLVDQVTLVLEDLHVRKAGAIRKVVTLGEYGLDVTIDRVTGRLRTGAPAMTFGGNRIQLTLPMTLASGTGAATVRFKWDGRNVAGAVCGDLDLTRQVSGGVKPDRYTLSGALVLSSTKEQILVTPRFPRLTLKLRVVPSAESWAAVKKVVADQEGVCGFVLERVSLVEFVERIVDKGFNVRLPTERLAPMAVPVGIEPSLTVRDRPLKLGVRVGGLAITEDVIWLGADIDVSTSG
jgi:hypothetical protein